MISPTIAAIIAATSTAPAAVSLATLASGFRSVVTKSTTDSIAVLTSSRAITSRDLILELVLMPFTMVLLYNFLVQNKRGLCNIVQKNRSY